MRKRAVVPRSLLIVVVACSATPAIADMVRVSFVADHSGTCEQPEDPALSNELAPPGQWIAGEFTYDSDIVGSRSKEDPVRSPLHFELDPVRADLRLSIGPVAPATSAGAFISAGLANDGPGDRRITFNFFLRSNPPAWPAEVDIVALSLQLAPKNDHQTTTLPNRLSLEDIVWSRFRMIGVHKHQPPGWSYPWVVCGSLVGLASTNDSGRLP